MSFFLEGKMYNFTRELKQLKMKDVWKATGQGFGVRQGCQIVPFADVDCGFGSDQRQVKLGRSYFAVISKILGEKR